MRTLALAATLLVLPLTAARAQQTPADGKWDAWLGCWELVLQNEGPARPSAPARENRRQDESTRPRVCVVAVPGGARFSTTLGAQTPIQQTVIADGREHPVSDDDCRGTQRAEWSRSGRLLFANAEMSCSNDRGTRRVSGLSIVDAGGAWTDVQAVDVSGQQTIRVRKYRRVSNGQATRRGAAAPLSLEDVKEAGTRVSSPALEAALVETGSTFGLSGKDLIALQDAGVPSTVTDLMVALSYPEKFVIERRARTDVPPPLLLDDPFTPGWAFGYPVWSDTYGFFSPLYGPYSPYYYSPFSYSYLPLYDPRFVGGGYVVTGGGSGGGSSSIQPSGRGRVVNGQGYTRVRPREAEDTSAPRSQAGSASSAAGGSASSSGGSSSSSSGGGSVSSQGFSSGGSSGDGGRTAQPR